MKTMKIIVLVASLLCANAFLAQDSLRRVIKLKTFWNAEEQEADFVKFNSYLSFGVALKSKKSDNFNEFELKELNLSSKDGFSEFESRVSLALNYEYNVRLFKKSKKMNYFIGGGVMSNLLSQKYRPAISTSFPYSNKSVNAIVTIVPRVQFRLAKKVGFEIKYNLGLLELFHGVYKTEDPIVPIVDRKFSYNNFDSLLSRFYKFYYARLGFGISYQL